MMVRTSHHSMLPKPMWRRQSGALQMLSPFSGGFRSVETRIIHRHVFGQQPVQEF